MGHWGTCPLELAHVHQFGNSYYSGSGMVTPHIFHILLYTESLRFSSVLYLHCESKKLDPFSFQHNLGKYCPILIILSLLQTEVNYTVSRNKRCH